MVTLAIALAVPPAVAVALAARTPEPRNGDLAAALHEPAFAGGSERLVELDPRGEPVVPDALVYWSPGAGESESLAPESTFLGSLAADAPRAFAVPGAAAGRVVVFSLAWQRVVRSLPVAAEAAP